MPSDTGGAVGLAAVITAIGSIVVALATLLVGEMRERRRTVTPPAPVVPPSTEEHDSDVLLKLLTEAVAERDKLQAALAEALKAKKRREG